jgi:Mn2+/Fe2+ NRAMP family transporter
MNTPSSTSSLLKALGPGLLFAAAAVGVSHLVQSTRAGASFGMGMLVVVLAANLIKYPAFRIGPQYAAATGQSLLHGYSRLGPWALPTYVLLTLSTMFSVCAAVTVVTAGLAMAVTGVTTLPAWGMSGLLLAFCVMLLGLGRYAALDLVSKILVAVLTVATLLATFMALGRLGGPAADSWSPFTVPWSEPATILFAVGLFGWMPSAIDVSVWQSLWGLERNRQQGGVIEWTHALKDFHIGYIGTTVLAVCFVIMGAGVMYGTGAVFEDRPGAFAGQVIGLYAQTLGEWTRPLVGIAAFSVMFSTTLTVADGFPRALSAAIARLREGESCDDSQDPSQRRTLFLALVATAILAVAMSSLSALVDLATTLSFLTAPVLSAMNHAAMHRIEPGNPVGMSPALARASMAGIVLQAAFAIGYLLVRFGGVSS